MKLKINILSGILLTLVSQIVVAESISDTYTIGEPLSVTILDNIKSAVNDNSSTIDASDGLPVNVLSADAAGNIDVTTKLTTPKIAVNGRSYFSHSGFLMGGLDSLSRSALVDLKNTGNWATILRIARSTGVIALSINGTGDAVFSSSVSAANYITTSDNRFKKNVTSLKKPLDKLLELRGVSFEWDVDKHERFKGLPGKQVGFIAQEVDKVLPELVFKDNEGNLSVSYNSMIPLLVEAVKDQQQVIKKLKNEVNSLEEIRNEMMFLKKQIGEMQIISKREISINEQKISMLNK